MPATSGSPTQIATSCLTKAELSGEPVDQFKNGDLGWAHSELGLPHGPLYALVKSGGPAVNGVTVLSVFQQPTMRWVSLSLLVGGGGGGGAPLITENQPVVVNGQTIFALGAIPAGATIMFVNGVQYRQGIDYTVAGLTVTWLDIPFVLNTNMTITFAYN